MKKYLFFVVLISFSFIAAGCLETNTVVKVNKDGSGTVEETLLFSSEVVQMIKQFADSTPDSGSAEKFSLFDKKQIKEMAVKMGEGVKFVSAKPLKTGGREGYLAVYSFKDIRKIKISQSPEKSLQLNEADSVDDEDGEIVTFDFQKGSVPMLTIKLPEQDFSKGEGKSKDSVDHQQNDFSDLQKAKQFLKDMRISITMEFAGSIDETDATYVDGNKVTLFDVNFGELLKHEDKLTALQKINPQSFEEAKDILKDIPGIKIEMNRNVIVKFQ